jgi:hypothetical protein
VDVAGAYSILARLSFVAALCISEKVKMPENIRNIGGLCIGSRRWNLDSAKQMTQGSGAFATSPIPLGTWVGTYTGESPDLVLKARSAILENSTLQTR